MPTRDDPASPSLAPDPSARGGAGRRVVRPWKALSALLAIAYPFAIFAAARVTPFLAAGLAFVAGLIILFVQRKIRNRGPQWFGALGMLALGGAAFALHDITPVLYYPVAMNGLMLALFGGSLFAPPTAIERIARLKEPDLPESGVAYTRRLTIVWCGFFVGNGTMALWTALDGRLSLWAFYNGFLAYVLMAGLVAGEWLLRRRLLGRKAPA